MWSVRPRRFALLLGLLFVLFAATAIGCDSTPTEPTPQPCTFTLSATTFAFGAAGGTGSVSVSTSATCAWTARANDGWLSITEGSSTVGAGVARFSAAANTETAARSGTLTIAGQVVSVKQDADVPVVCTYAVSPTTASFDKNGGNGQLEVTAPDSCAWTATSHASWVTVTGSDHGTGNGTVTYAVASNGEVAGRSTTMTVAGVTVAVTQSGDLDRCQYSVSPIQFSPCMHTPFELRAAITTADVCPWTAGSGASWITMTSAGTGTGSGVVGFMVTDNYDAPRAGVVMVRWPTATAGQNLQVAQAGCSYAVSRTDISFTSTGGTGTFDVIQQSNPLECGGPLQNGCVWTAVSDVGWITITSSMPRAGDDRVFFTVTPNTGPSARVGTITVRNKAVRIVQSGASPLTVLFRPPGPAFGR